jgi:protein phosphatase
MLTITYSGRSATDLGYLLHKNPLRIHTTELAFGNAHVFYPEGTTDRCTAALLMDASKRLAAGKLVVIDATNVQTEARKPIINLAREYHCLPVAIVFDMPERLCQDRNRERSDRNFGPHVVRQHLQQLRRSLRGLEREGFRNVHILRSPEEADAAEIVREPLWNNLKHE